MNTEITKRAYDSKYVVWVKMDDPNAPSDLSPESVSKRWVALGVYDGYNEAKNAEKHLVKKYATSK